MNNKKVIGVVADCFDEESNLSELYDRLVSVF